MRHRRQHHHPNVEALTRELENWKCGYAADPFGHNRLMEWIQGTLEYVSTLERRLEKALTDKSPMIVVEFRDLDPALRAQLETHSRLFGPEPCGHLVAPKEDDGTDQLGTRGSSDGPVNAGPEQ